MSRRPFARAGRHVAAALVVIASLCFGTAGAAGAQTPPATDAASDAPPAVPSAEAEAAARVHEAGGYPNDIVVLDDEDGGEESARGSGEGAGDGPTGRIGTHGERDGGDPQRSLDFPMPQFVQDFLQALANLFGIAARPIGYVLFALGIAIVIALVVYLIVMMRLPKVDLRATLRRDGGTAPEPVLDPLLEGSNATAEEHAAAGRFREAIHALFLRALREATKAGDVDRRGRTAREVVGLVERAHGAIAPLDALLSLTELVWFGGRAATEAQYLEARELALAVEAHARAMGPALPIGAPA